MQLKVTSVAQLRNISARIINSADPYYLYQDPGYTGSGPSIDNYVLQHFPGHVFNRGEQMQIPLLAGWNAAEEFLFLSVALPHNTS